MSWTSHFAGRHCPECSVEVDPDARFCERCGMEVPAVEAPSENRNPWPVPQSPNLRPPAEPPEAGAATQTYLGYRLMYSDTSTDFNPLSNLAYQRMLFFQFLATLAAWIVLTAGLALLQLFASILSFAQQDDTGLPTGTLGVTTAAGAVLSLLASVLLACLFWFRPLSVQLTEWMITIDGAGDGARAALEHMYLIVHNRQTPVRTLRVVRLRAARQQQRDYLRLDDGHFSGFVSSFNYGTDLFIGWTFWLTMSPAQWLWLSLRRMFRSSSNNIYVSLVNDQPKAMREVMHAAVRQGVDMATGRIRPIGQGALGSTVPYTTVEA